MSAATVVIVAVVIVAALAILFVATSSARRDRRVATGVSRETRKRDRSHAGVERLSRDEGTSMSGREVERAAVAERLGTGGELVPAAPAPPPAIAPLDDDALAVTRRQFLNRGAFTLMGVSLGAFGASLLAFLWPPPGGGFGSKIRAGKVSDILSTIRDTKEPFYVAEARTWVAPYPDDALAKAKKAYSDAELVGMEAGVVALYQKCVHLGCRVPWCQSAQWFECPCHGSKYNRVGEKKGGPAPRGLDRFPVQIQGGVLLIDTKKPIQGPAIGINTTGQEAEGPHCA